MLAEGAIAPDFTLGSWSLAEALKTGPVLLAFFKISCPTCQLALPFLQRLADGARPGAPQLVAISQDDRGGTDQFRKRFGISMPAQLDAAPAYKASNLYRIDHVPSLFLIEPGGTISMSVTGFSKPHIEKLGQRFGVTVFRPDDDVPVLRPG